MLSPYPVEAYSLIKRLISTHPWLTTARIKSCGQSFSFNSIIKFNKPFNKSLKGYQAIFSVPRNYNFRNLRKGGLTGIVYSILHFGNLH